MLFRYTIAPRRPAFSGRHGKGRIFMRRNIIATLALLLWGAGLTAAAVAQQPVKLGVLNDQTGLYADLTGMGSVHAARMAVEDYGGKVLGRPIEVIFADHQNKPDIGANLTRQWIETEGVNVILDIPNSAVGLAVREVTRTHDAVDINTGAATSDLSGKACSPHGFGAPCQLRLLAGQEHGRTIPLAEAPSLGGISMACLQTPV
jgi:hypothetical protein